MVDNSPGKWLQGKLDSLELDLVAFLLMNRLVFDYTYFFCQLFLPIGLIIN